MPIGKSESQPDRLLSLADENPLVSIGHQSRGRRHSLALSRTQARVAMFPEIIQHVANRLKPDNSSERIGNPSRQSATAGVPFLSSPVLVVATGNECILV